MKNPRLKFPFRFSDFLLHRFYYLAYAEFDAMYPIPEEKDYEMGKDMVKH